MKKLFTSLMLMLFAVLAVNAQSVVYTLDTSLEENKGTDNGYATAGDVTVDGITWNATGNVTMSPWRIGGKSLTAVDREVKTTTAYPNALTKIVLTLGEQGTSITVNSVSLSWADNADFTNAQTISEDYANVIEFAPEAGFAANSYYKFTINVTVPGTSNKFVTFNKVEFYGEAPATGWDGTVTTSFTGAVTKLEDLNNLTLTFPGASTIEILGEEDCQYLALQNENGSDLYGVWAPTMGSDYTINGNSITLAGFMAMEGVTGSIPAGTTKLYVEDYGTLVIDGKADYLETMEFDANFPATAEPFMFTSVTNNDVAGSVAGVEASEQGVFYTFKATATGKVLSKGDGVPTLSLMEDATVDFGEANILTTEGESANIRFMGPQQYYFTQPGTYVLSIPEGTFVDAEGTPNAAATLKWVIIQGEEPGTFAITGATNAQNEPGTEVEALSYTFEITAANAITGLHEGNITLTDADNQPVGGNAYVFGYEGEGGSNTVYARFTFDTEDHNLHTAGTYTLNVPAGMFADAEGNLSEAYTASWTVKAQPEVGTFAITGATNAGNETGTEVEALSYMFNITAANAVKSLHEGNITLTDAEGQPVGGNAYVYGYEGEGGSNTVYARFTFDTEDHQLHTPGVYTLNVPAGMFKDAEGNLSEAYTASWTVTGSSNIVIETIEIGTVDKNFDEITDTYYTATVKFQKPEGAVYAYTEGLQVSLNGETSNMMFMAPNYGYVELGAEDEVTLVYTDGMKAATNDPKFDGELRQPGSYVATTTIAFMDENGMEILAGDELVTATYTGSIVLPNLNPVEIGEPVFSVDNDPYYGMISKGDLEVQGLTMTFPEAKNITPDMQIKVVATLQQYTVAEDEIDPGFTAPTFVNVEGLENVEFYGDAMFGDAVVNMDDFTAYILENDPTAYMVTVSSIEVIGNGVEASWTANPEEGDVYGTTFEVKADEPACEIFFNVEEGAEIDLAETKSINVNVGVTDLTGTDAELYIEGMVYGKDGTAQPIVAFTDFEDGVDVNISRLTPGNSYQIVITKVAYGDVIDMDPETYMPIYENTFEDENGLATLNFSIKAEVPSIDATVQVNGTELKVIFPEGTDLGDNYAEKPYILSGNETIEVADYCIDNTTGEFLDPLNLIVITLNEKLADGEYTVVLPAGMFIVNGGENNTEWSYSFTIEGGVTTGINAVNASNNEVMFNIAGQRVNNAKGIVIKNGKKFLNK